MRKILFLLVFALPLLLGSTWGFFAHRHINRLAVYTLPLGMLHFYKRNIHYITEHAVAADKRRYADTAEAAKHFIDIDKYGPTPFDSIPKKWTEAAAKYGEPLLHEHGIVPWQIQRTYFALTDAFRAKDSLRILRYSADLGHYISDAHVPLHTTQNYNGQLTGQTGIHGFWESRLPELFHKEYDFIVGKARYICDPLKEAWAIVEKAHSFTDSVLLIESRLNGLFRSDAKFSYSLRNGRIERQHSEQFAISYHKAMNGMVEEQMRSSILKTGSYWYSAWIDAGQPSLTGLIRVPMSANDRIDEEAEETSYKAGKIIGRAEN